MPLYAAFHQGLHCLTKHLFAGKPCRMKMVLIGPRLFLLGQGRSSQVSISVFRPIQSNRSSPVTVSRHRRVLSRIPWPHEWEQGDHGDHGSHSKQTKQYLCNLNYKKKYSCIELHLKKQDLALLLYSVWTDVLTCNEMSYIQA